MQAAPDPEVPAAPVLHPQGNAAGPGASNAPRVFLPAMAPVLHMPRLWRNLTLGVLVLVLAVATWFAAKQPPHPDMFRPLALWEMGRADWWAYPLERNAFKRMVVRGDLSGVFVLPDGQHIWAVGEAGLIIHSGDGGRSWEQQRPVRGDAKVAAASAGLDAWLGWLPSAQAQSNPPQKNDLQKQQQLAPPVLSVDAVPNEPANAVVRPPLSPDEALKAAAAAKAVGAPALNKIEALRRALPAPKKAVAPPAAKTVAKAASAPAAAASLPEALPPPRREGEADLTNVFFVSASSGWAVGSDGTVLATRDGGSTWVAQNSGTRSRLEGLHFAGDGLSGWAVGDAGTVLGTRDGGASWTAQTSGIKSRLSAVRFADDGRTGWVAGEPRNLLAARDGGGLGAAQTSRPNQSHSGVQLSGDAQGWSVSRDATVLSTQDGGATWVAQNRDRMAWPKGVHFVGDAQTGWAVGIGGTVLGTRDGGSTWAAQKSGTTASLSAVHFSADARTGWAVGEEGTVLATRDGGSTWVSQTSGLRASLNGLYVADDGLKGWAVGEEGTVLHTRDGGSTWLTSVTPTGASLISVRFASDALRGVVVGDDGTVLTTSDGGSSWAGRPRMTPSFTTSAFFLADLRRAWVGGVVGEIFATRDGGSSWTAQFSGSKSALAGLHFSDDGLKGWAVGGDGTVLSTRNGGDTWSSQSVGADVLLFDVYFAGDALTGSAVGADGKVFGTRDGGTTWTPQVSGTKEALNGVQLAADGLKGWAVGNRGTVLSTRDGGGVWARQPTGALSTLWAVQFDAEGRRGWAAGRSATVLRTDNGGTTWREPAVYRVYWAPWYFALLTALLALIAGLVALVEPVTKGSRPIDTAATPGGTATTLSSDQPVLDKAGDRLGYRAAVEALSSFIRNRATEPRVTIAVSGEWGTGKSSIMRMLQSDLESAGFRTAWFNAWHQQQEGRQLSALFNTIRSQAVPRWWGSQFIAALRVRSRLIWGRGLFYKLVAVASAIGCALLLGDLLGDGAQTAWANLRANVQHHVLQRQQTAITGASIAKLDPLHKSAPATAASAPAGEPAPLQTSAASGPGVAGPGADPCTDEARRRTHKKAEPVRLAVYCALKRNYLWDQGEDGSNCGVDRPQQADAARRCIFDSAADLIATINKQDKDGVQELWPSEEKAIRAAAETLPPPPLFRWLENSLLGGLAGFIALLFTKGVSVYGLQLTAPLRALLAGADKDKDAGKESAGTVERYRGEFSLLCDALDGRLVVFIDDLDRCSPATVNGILEMTNYLADVGRCFVVIGAAIERVKANIAAPADVKDKDGYANEYLRKLIHIELPVPLRRAELEELLRDRQGDAGAAVATRWRRGAQVGFRIVLAALVAGTLVGVFATGKFLHDTGNGTAQRIVPRPWAQPAADERADAAQVPAAAPKPSPAVAPEPTAARDVGLSASAPPVRPWSAGVVGLLVVAAGFAWRWLRRHRDSVLIALGGALRPLDSDEFMQALRIWNPVVIEHDPTPRHVKRFYNRARLFASYDNEEARATGQAATLDPALVMMAALHHVDPLYLERLRSLVADAEASHTDPSRALNGLPAELGLEAILASSTAPTPFARCFISAWRAHLQTFSEQPSAAQIQRFADRVSGIHVR